MILDENGVVGTDNRIVDVVPLRGKRADIASARRTANKMNYYNVIIYKLMKNKFNTALPGRRPWPKSPILGAVKVAMGPRRND